MAWGLVWLMHHLVLIVSFSVFSPRMKWRGDALRPLQPPPPIPTHAEDSISPPGTGGGPESLWEADNDMSS